MLVKSPDLAILSLAYLPMTTRSPHSAALWGALFFVDRSGMSFAWYFSIGLPRNLRISPRLVFDLHVFYGWNLEWIWLDSIISQLISNEDYLVRSKLAFLLIQLDVEFFGFIKHLTQSLIMFLFCWRPYDDIIHNCSNAIYVLEQLRYLLVISFWSRNPRIGRTRARYSVRRVLLYAEWKDPWMKPMDPCANVINLKILRELVSKDGAKVFCRRHTFNGLIVERTPEKIKSRPFEKNVGCMVLKLTAYIRNVISFSCKRKTRWNSDNLELFSDIFNCGLYFTENRPFWARPWLWRHCDVILGMLELILVFLDRGDP